ncbi:MAG: methyltransferase domain-containing protein [Cryomorphaceae bacterium]|nr:methyltransferase domain-containing protein [Cryomorphaceae bacterium]
MLKKQLRQLFHQFKFELYAYKTSKLGERKAKSFHHLPEIKLHLACGEVYKEGWVNIDLFSKGADLKLDLRRPLPFPNDSCDEIYSEHFLEHLWFPYDALDFLKELHRVIKPGGKVVTGVPDSAWPMKSYFEGDHADYFRLCKENNWHPKTFKTRMEHINYHFRQDGEHQFAYDEETLVLIMEKAGFSENTLRPFDPAMDSISRQPGSLYVESCKV